jgi:hypothetical protein
MSVWINRPSSTRFQARVRPRGHRKYRLVGKPSRSFLVALKALTNTFGKSSYYKRGDVICTADYYDPIVCCEIVRP